MKVIQDVYFPDNETQFDRWLIDGTYQLQTLECAVRHAKQRRVAVDVGAHVGLWSRELAKAFKSVHSFEPVSEHRECFRKNVSAKNVTLYPEAIAHVSNVSVEYHSAQEGNTGSVFMQPTSGTNKFALTARLDDFIWFDVDLLKIDVEGMELHVLMGGEQLLEEWKPVVVLEDKGHSTRYGVARGEAGLFLQKRGYTMVESVSNDYIFTKS